MRHVLKRHPDSRSIAATQVDVEVVSPHRGGLLLSYVVIGEIGEVRMPPVTASARGEELWQGTCFEAFVRASPGEAYYEFNLSPSTQWAVYRFSGYRAGMCVAVEAGAVPIEVHADADRYTLQAALDLDRLSGLPRRASWRIGLSALIEDTGGRMSYWALAHPPGKPDFHHADCFAHELAPAVVQP